MKKLTILLLITTFSISAAPVRFDFVFDDPNSTARTVGYIVFEESLLSNPVDEIISLPSPKVLDLQLTVTGSIYSDGTYDLNDYASVDFYSNGGVLDFSQPLIGQPTADAPWGTTFDGDSGEFNLFTHDIGGQNISSARHDNNRGNGSPPISDAPTGCFWFTLCESFTNMPTGNALKGIGGPSPMELQSMQPNRGTPTARSVPSLSTWSVLTLATIFLVMAGLFRRRLN